MPIVLPCPLWPGSYQRPHRSSRLRRQNDGFGISFNCISAGTNTLGPVLVVRSNNLRAVLVVENERLLSLDSSEALKGEGYNVTTVTNADDAIKVLESCNNIRRSSPT